MCFGMKQASLLAPIYLGGCMSPKLVHATCPTAPAGAWRPRVCCVRLERVGTVPPSSGSWAPQPFHQSSNTLIQTATNHISLWQVLCTQFCMRFFLFSLQNLTVVQKKKLTMRQNRAQRESARRRARAHSAKAGTCVSLDWISSPQNTKWEWLY